MNPIVSDQKNYTVRQLSAQQRRFWVLEQLEQHVSSHHVPVCLRIGGKLNTDLLNKATQVVRDRHAALHCYFVMEGDEPQCLPSPASHEALQVVDLTSLPERERTQAAFSRFAEEIQRPFDLRTGPLVRERLFRLAPDDHVYLLILHRIICDARSAQILAREIVDIYSALTAGHPLPQAASQHSDYVRLQQNYISSADKADDLAYWNGKLQNAPNGLELPADRPRAMVPSLRGLEQKIVIGDELLGALRKFCRNEGSTPFNVLLTTFFGLLGRYTGAEDIVIGTELAGRLDASIANVVGPLSNQAVLRAVYSSETSFREMLSQVSALWSETEQHQKLPFGILLDSLNVRREVGRNPLFQISFSQSFVDSPVDAGNLHWEPVRIPTGIETLDLRVEVIDHPDQIELFFSYSSDLFEPATIERMMGHFRTLLQSAVETPEQSVSRLQLLTPSERRQLVVDWNNTGVEYPPGRCIHQLVEQQAQRTPGAVAVVYESQSLTYSELNQRANQLAHFLRKLGVGPDVLVAMCMERSLEMLVGILGVLKAGGAYLPLDLSYPPERLAFMIEDANPPIVLTQEALVERLPKHGAKIVRLDSDWPAIATESGENPEGGSTPDNLAYIIYTSGSTGKPKGCLVTHFNVVRLFQATWNWYKFDEHDVWSMFHSYAFDFTVWEIWGALFYGGRVVVVPFLVSRSPEAFYKLLHDERVTVLNQTPSAFRQLIQAEESVGAKYLALRYVIFGGEALEMHSLKPWYARHGDKKPLLVNMYGITETTVHVTYRPLSLSDTTRGSVIGRSIPDLQLYVLDQHRQPVPIGVTGEMYVGGAGVARGYLNRPELTNERFIPDPFSTRPGARLYKTGDLARFLPDGDMEYLGRIDHQVKIRGFRIELGEIESALASHSSVHHGLVMARDDGSGDKRLVAYLVPKPGEQPNIADVRNHLRQSLPEYMIPSVFSVLPKFPLTPTGKIDRGALPAPQQEQRDRSAVIAPRNETEALLVPIFREILKVDSVSVDDDFFDLGGHSLMAARLVSRIQAATGYQIPLAALFRAATIESLAELIEQGTDVSADPVVLEIQHGTSDRLPFFAIVPPGEESLGYAMLARHMGPEQTVYKIQGHAPITHSKRPYTEQEMMAMSDEYIAAMRSVQPHGPYCLGGLCDGTHIAEQIVLKLEAQGEEIGLFAIFDTWVLQHSQNRWLWKIYYYQQRLRGMKKLSLSERLASYKRTAGNKVQTLVGTKATRVDWRHAYWPENFTPARFRAPVILFKRPKQPFYYVSDPLMGWGARTNSGVEIHEVDFSHLQILREPHVAIFGKELALCVARVTTTSASLSTNHPASLVAAGPGHQHS